LERKFISGSWYVKYTDVVANTRKLSLKEHEAFVVVDQQGDIPCVGNNELGYYFRDTRFLSGLEFFLEDKRPLFLSSDIGNLGAEIRAILTNPDMEINGIFIPRSTIFIQKSYLLFNDNLTGNIHIKNFSETPLSLKANLCLGADFKDIFEVRGKKREQRGTLFSPVVHNSTLIFKYRGADKILRTTFVNIHIPFEVEEIITQSESACVRIKFKLILPPKGDQSVTIQVSRDHPEKNVKSYAELIKLRREKLISYLDKFAYIRTDNEKINEIISRAAKDLNLMITITEEGPITYAGIPWFSTIFGRDSIITAYQLLPWYPELARGTLKFLAKYQGKTLDDFTDQEPGKIIHELRQGELANLREIPFIPYYGTVDATPLFLILAGEYFETTGDIEFIKNLKENLLMAFKWLTDRDYNPNISEEGFLFYKRRSPYGLDNQGWKDSGDSITYSSGKIARPPIATIEAQGYKYRALVSFADLMKHIDRNSNHIEIALKEAERVKKNIHLFFQYKRRNFYAIALDGKKRRCNVISSNPGHLLFSKVVSKNEAEKIVNILLSEEMFSGYGIRTLGTREKRFNPISYHNGSVWPHDNSIIAEGMSFYGFRKEIGEIFISILDAVSFFPNFRVPELFSGFERTEFHGPIPYPTACSPQAWASGSIFLMIKAMLGLNVNAIERTLYISRPYIPREITRFIIENLRTPDGIFNIIFKKEEKAVSVEVIRKPHKWKVQLI